MSSENTDPEKIRTDTKEMLNAIIFFIESHKEITCIPKSHMTTFIKETHKSIEVLSSPQNASPKHFIQIGINTIRSSIYIFTEAYFFHPEKSSGYIGGAIRAMKCWIEQIPHAEYLSKDDEDILKEVAFIFLDEKGICPHLIKGIKYGVSSPYRDMEQLKSAQTALTKNSESNEALINTHRNELDELSKQLSILAQQTGFVELNEAFSSLIREKKKELKVIYWVLGSFAALSSCTPILIYCLLNTNQYPLEINTSATYLHFAPLFAVELILIYFFRIALGRFNGVKAQLLQIGLRQTLCQFIEKYVDFNEKNKEKASGALEKLELLLFSNIMPTEDKVPSVLDGLESIANLIKNKK